MDAIILAGGKGERLRAVLPELPKVLAPVGNRPFLTYILDRLVESKIERIILSVGYLSQNIINAIGHNYKGCPIDYSIEDVLLGTGGGIKQSLMHVTSSPVLVMNGDTFINVNIDDLIIDWMEHRSSIIVLKEVKDSHRYGRVTTIKSKITGFVPKGVPGPGYINAGCYLIPNNLLTNVPLLSPFSFEYDILQKEEYYKNFRVHKTDEYFIDIGIPEDYVKAQKELKT